MSSKSLDLTLESSAIHVLCPYFKNFQQITAEYINFIAKFVSHVCLLSGPVCNNDLLNVNRSDDESCCSTVFSCDFC